MDTTPHDFVTVDMRGGLKAALVARARVERQSVSALVRRAVVNDLALEARDQAEPAGGIADGTGREPWIKLSIRMTRGEADRLAAGARAASLSRGAYLAGLLDGVPVLASGGGRAEHISALTASCAELSTFSRNLHQLTELLRTGKVQQALQYRDLLDSLADDVRAHLKLAAQVLAELSGPRRPTQGTAAGHAHGRTRWPKA